MNFSVKWIIKLPQATTVKIISFLFIYFLINEILMTSQLFDLIENIYLDSNTLNLKKKI